MSFNGRNPVAVSMATAAKIAAGNDLLNAAGKGDIEAVKKCLLDGVPIDYRNKDGYNALHFAAYVGNYDMVKLLVQKEANSNLKTIRGYTPLNIAADKGFLHIVQYLSDSGAALSTMADNGDTPLHFACHHGFLPLTKYLCAAGVNMNRKNTSGFTPLHCACFNNHCDTAKLLLEAGAQVNLGDGTGRTPLHWAAEIGNVDLVKCLCAAGAKTFAQDNNGRTPVMEAKDKGHSDVEGFLSSRSGICAAAEGGDVNTMRTLVASGVHIDTKDEDGLSALANAARNGHLEAVEFACQSGAAVDEVAMDGKSALHFAVIHGHYEVVRCLHAYKAALSTQDAMGMSPLHEAARRGLNQLVSFLCESGADMTARDQRGWTSLHCAADAGHVNIIILFCTTGAGIDITAKCDDQKTALEMAREKGHEEAVKYLEAANGQMAAAVEMQMLRRELEEACKAKEDLHEENAALQESLDEALMTAAEATRASQLAAQSPNELLERMNAAEHKASGAALELLSLQQQLRVTSEDLVTTKNALTEATGQLSQRAMKLQMDYSSEELSSMMSLEQLAEMISTCELTMLKLREATHKRNLRTQLELEKAKEDFRKRQVEQEESSNCCICMSKPKSVLLLPCRHLCACEDCSDALQDCPICRVPVAQNIKVYS